MLAIWAFGNQLTFITVAVSNSRVINICDFSHPLGKLDLLNNCVSHYMMEIPTPIMILSCGLPVQLC